jgi:hypothetical protein
VLGLGAGFGVLGLGAGFGCWVWGAGFGYTYLDRTKEILEILKGVLG